MAEIMKDAHARLHFDPVMYLPHEIISTILEYADPNTLISAAIVSRAWKQRSSEPRLWRRLFIQEGWIYDAQYLEQFEANARRQIASLRLLHDTTVDEDTNMDTETQDTVLKHVVHHQGPLRLWAKNGRLGTERPVQIGEGAGSTAEQRPSSIVSHDGNMDNTRESLSEDQEPRRVYTPLLDSHDLLNNQSSNPRFDWRYLYKQRRRLEENWNTGRYTNFRLPRHDHPEEAHTQCVYTMQFSNKHVVTGSRDRTVRIWDLETRRLKIKPLTGHRGSVLCLQFDESPGQDVLVSGGSDSDVIVWTFSTGHMFKRLKNAHSDSVLNLCFDHRYLVTCSKDKTIKLWNRRSLLPTHPEYPPSNQAKDADFPDYIVNLPDIINSAALNRIQPLERYSLVMTLNGHNAAVNAIQIHENEIVSASGDRKIFLWSISQGQLLRQFSGHTKGIACVQYDGKRIVSGSSDRTVRVFDSKTGVELVALAVHRDLVRTVQADFADAPGSQQEYKAQAKNYGQEVARLRPAGRHRVAMFLPSGADLPFGGGGNEWSKIVSGSYDETVMIWKKGRGGKWNVIRELRQEDAMRMTAGPSLPEEARVDIQNPLAAPDAIFPDTRNESASPVDSARPSGRTHHQSGGMPRSIGRIATVRGASAGIGPLPAENDDLAMPDATTMQIQGQAHVPAHLNPQHPLFAYSAPPSAEPVEALSSTSRLVTAQASPHTLAYTGRVLTVVQPTSTLQTSAQPALHPFQPLAPAQHHSTTSLPYTTSAPPHQNSTPQQTAASAANASAHFQAARAQQPDPNAQTQAQGHPPHRHHRRPPAPIEDDLIGASRVFKLQFNSRFIVCCSQQPVIVGWDFANGDAELEEASAFFGMPRGS